VVALIELVDFSFQHSAAESPVLRRVNLSFKQGEFGLVSGPTGSGKSTLLRALNGLVPHFSGGLASGSVLIDGREMLGKQPHDFASLVGFVNQQPEGSFVAATVAEEIAFGMEQLGFEPNAMDARVRSIAATLGIDQLLNSPTDALSGGQQQRVAIASAIAAGQQVLLLDEPTSALDADAAGQLVDLLRELSSRRGITVIIAEHRVERILGVVDSLTIVHGDGSVTKEPASAGFDALLRNYKMVPPAVELGQKLGWSPLPLTVAAARAAWNQEPGKIDLRKSANSGEPALEASEISVAYSGAAALRSVSLSVSSGQILAVIGPNGSGKSSLLWALQGSQQHSGRVSLQPSGSVPSRLAPAELLQHLAMVPQDSSDLLVLSTVRGELANSDAFAKAAAGTTAGILAGLAGRIDPARHPRDLSSGQQLALVLAIQLAKGAKILLLDEPTRGLDYEAKRRLVGQLNQLRTDGKAIVVASHDAEFLAAVADQAIVLAAGQVVQRGEAHEVLSSMGKMAPQIWQVTGSAIHVDEVHR
jgi:energy-coupling factor transporter ATP-binding protein EcfA2